VLVSLGDLEYMVSIGELGHTYDFTLTCVLFHGCHCEDHMIFFLCCVAILFLSSLCRVVIYLISMVGHLLPLLQFARSYVYVF